MICLLLYLAGFVVGVTIGYMWGTEAAWSRGAKYLESVTKEQLLEDLDNHRK